MLDNTEKSEQGSGALPGHIYTGKVLKIKPFGAIVSLPNSAPGLVHISQIANGFIQSVADVLNIGDEVDVRVVSNDAATGKISLSMKDVPQRFEHYGDDEEGEDEEGFFYRNDPPPVISAAQAANFEEKFKSWQKLSNERIAGINRRNKRNKRR
ncbi:MAG: S1 RNA-binding domain-containing protein [Defluviitaleaceae bacterium]|nr:S1 RNA-binding domain-containing protein [Defluviitaleaceae bacterium]MCL2263144.1 S1 RNA-binding domain-containing protein [Defluviitaleaceae bacterium]